MRNSIKLNDILCDPKGLSPAIEQDWKRQKLTAEEITSRFKDGRCTVLVADEVGMGKTYVALATMAQHIFQSENNDRKVLLVVPTSSVLSTKWKQEILTFNETYLSNDKHSDEHERTIGKQLRPLVVRDNWELVQNLHNYNNIDACRMLQVKREYFTFLFCEWYNATVRKHRVQKKKFPAYNTVTKYTPGLLDFCSFVSPQTLNIFLSEWFLRDPTKCDEIVTKLDQGEPAQKEISNLYRNFCAQQDVYEPNIFIVSMGMLQRESRRDNENMQLLCTYMVGRLMSGVWEGNKSTAYNKLKNCGMIAAPATGKGSRKWRDEMTDINLWGLKSVVDRVIRKSKSNFVNTFLTSKPEERKAFLVDLKNEILRCKLDESGVTLAVVDEVHNWKNGKSNGAKIFRDNYAPFICYKLIMSATPFQLCVDELRRIFEIAAGIKASERGKEGTPPESEDMSARIVADITKGSAEGLAERCLSASKRFSDAWKSLSQQQITMLADVLKPQCDVQQVIALLHKDTKTPHALSDFCKATLEYHESLKCYGDALSKVVIRHTKNKDIRRFHAGSDFVIKGNPDAAKVHRVLHESKGYALGTNALLDAIGMRTQQRIRRAVGDTGGVRLLGGLNSSYEAFKESWRGQGKEESLDAATQAYTDLFVRLLDGATHPKVEITVKRAVCNYRMGKKTLIFCERRPTQAALENKIKQCLHEYIPDFSNLPKVREAVLRDFKVVEYYLSRSIMESQKKRIKLTKVHRDATWIRLQKTLALLAKDKAGVINDRQMSKLIDLCLVNVLFSSTSFGVFANILDDSYALKIYLRKQKPNVESASPVIEYDDTLDMSAVRQYDKEDIASSKFDEILQRILVEKNKSIWCPFDNIAGMHNRILALFQSEKRQLMGHQQPSDASPAPSVLASLLLEIPQGLRSVLLRLDVLSGIKLKTSDLGDRIVQLLRDQCSTDISTWRDTEEFLRLLCEAKGSLRSGAQASRRHSLWRGVFLKEQSIVQSLNGDTPPDTRVNLCAAFNSPLLPAVLLCTSVGSEGIDLHLQCAEVIHHDLPWNPAKLEQRTGRVDRVGSLAERMSCQLPANKQGCKINIGIPFMASNYDEFQYNVLWSRSQKQEVLFGEPDYTAELDEDKNDDDGSYKIADPQPDDAILPNAHESRLPEALVNFLKVDLSLRRNNALEK